MAIPSFQADGILTPKIQRAIEHYLDTKDIARAAVLAGLDPLEFTRAMERPEVKKEVERRLEIEQQAMAELRAKARVLSVDFLDDSLVTAVKEGATKGDVKAITLGYERLGLRRDDNFMTEQQASHQERPNYYRVLEQKSVTTTVTEIARTPEAHALPAPKTIEGNKPVSPQISMDIEEY